MRNVSTFLVSGAQGQEGGHSHEDRRQRSQRDGPGPTVTPDQAPETFSEIRARGAALARSLLLPRQLTSTGRAVPGTLVVLGATPGAVHARKLSDPRLLALPPMKRVTRVGLWPAVVCAAGLLLLGYGSSGDQSQSSRSRTDVPAPDQAKSDSTKQPMAVSPADSKEKEKQSKNSREPAGTDAANPGAETAHRQHRSPEPVREPPNPTQIKGCSTGMTKSQCEAVGKAYQQQQESDPDIVEEGECPGAMSKDECRAAGEAYEEAQEGRIVRPSECPGAMTAEQCAEAGKAYEEVVR